MTRELHPGAEQEFREATQWYGEQSLFAGERFVAAIQVAIESISRDPLRYQRVGESVRVFRLDRFPYKLYYEFDVNHQHLYVLCIMHNKRRPEYWRDRMTGGL